MKATSADRERLEAEARRMADRLADLGAEKVILFGSLARGKISLFSDIDLLVIFDDPRSARELTRWVYQQIDPREALDLLAYNPGELIRISQRPFIHQALTHGKVLYERTPRRG